MTNEYGEQLVRAAEALASIEAFEASASDANRRDILLSRIAVYNTVLLATSSCLSASVGELALIGLNSQAFLPDLPEAERFPLILTERDYAYPHLRTTEIAELLGLSSQTVLEKIRSGEIKGFGVRSKVRTAWYGYTASVSLVQARRAKQR